MSGVAGGDRISREHIDSTAKSYIDTVLSRFPGFQSAEVTGSVAAGKKDFGDIDLIVHIEGNDKKAIKKELQNYLENQSVNKILPFRSEKYQGKRSYNAGELVSILYPQTDAGKTAQIDNIIAVTRDESTFKKSFLDWPAEKQGLVLGLVKVAIQEANVTNTVEKLFSTISVDIPKTNDVVEFNLSGQSMTYNQTSQSSWSSSNGYFARTFYGGFRRCRCFYAFKLHRASSNPKSRFG